MATTLADSLLDDLDDLSDQDEGTNDQEEDGIDPSKSTFLSNAADADADADADANGGSEIAASSLKRTNAFLDDEKLKAHMSAIQTAMDCGNSESQSVSQSVSQSTRANNDEGQYQLMTTSNKYLIAIQNELGRASEDLIIAYKPKFPELEDLLPNPISYKNAVKVIQNEMDLTLVNEQLSTEAKLTSNQIITLSVASSTTQGEPLTTQQLSHVHQCIAYMEDILDAKSKLISFVESHMERLAPNTCVLIGPTLAARMVANAGGLAELSRIPACNLQVLGQVKATSASRAGLSTSISASQNRVGASMGMGVGGMGGMGISRPHEGMLAECDLYNRVPSHLKRKALKVIAAKMALAIRCDFVNLESGRKRTNASGMKFYKEIEKKFAKLIEPDVAPVIKALPKPDLETKKRRGGKRMRLLKEQFSESEMMKQANRRVFSTETGEYGDDAMGLTLGMLEKNKDGSGNVRHMAGSAANKRKTRQANTKASRKKAAQMNAGGNKSGLASSMVFTPVQGLELVNPDAMSERVKAANNKWFSESSGFQSALPKKK